MIQNNCKINKEELHKTQQFLKQYFKPSSKQKGLLLYHSLGSGKTCAAISIATNFEDENYSILWVTRNSLKNVVYQNLFGDFICHPKINPDKLGDTQQKRFGHFNKVTNKTWLKPISYKSFSNIVKKKSSVYKDLVQRNGSDDPFKKTLVIIDEAHNFTTEDALGFTKHESAKFNDIAKMIYESYNKSKNDSVRILMLSATPALNGVKSVINMLNLLIPNKDERLPSDMNKFMSDYLNSSYTDFNNNGKKHFNKIVSNNVSFLDTTKDYTRFSRKLFEIYKDPLSKNNLTIQKKFDKLKNTKLSDVCNKSKLNKDIMNIINAKGFKTNEKFDQLQNNLKYVLNNDDKEHIYNFMRDIKKMCKDDKTCIDELKEDKKDSKEKINDIITKENEICKDNFKNIKKNKMDKFKGQMKKKEFLIKNNQQDALEKCNNSQLDLKQKLKCLKKTSVWNYSMNKYKYDSKTFDNNKDDIKNMLPTISQKFYKLMNTIKELDRKDKCLDKKTYKHVIYLDDKKYIKVLMGTMIAYGYNFILKPMYKSKMRKGKKVNFKSLDIDIPEKKSNKNFVTLTKTPLNGRFVGKNLKNKIKDEFNKRPTNIYGKNIRFLIMDQDFLEGVSFFDTKYLHILTEPETEDKMEQLIGRIIRRCGHKGLPTDKYDGGWKSYIHIYTNKDKNEILDETINKLKLQKELKNKTTYPKIKKILINDMQQYALDKELDNNIKNIQELINL